MAARVSTLCSANQTREGRTRCPPGSPPQVGGPEREEGAEEVVWPSSTGPVAATTAATPSVGPKLDANSERWASRTHCGGQTSTKPSLLTPQPQPKPLPVQSGLLPRGVRQDRSGEDGTGRCSRIIFYPILFPVPRHPLFGLCSVLLYCYPPSTCPQSQLARVDQSMQLWSPTVIHPRQHPRHFSGSWPAVVSPPASLLLSHVRFTRYDMSYSPSPGG